MYRRLATFSITATTKVRGGEGQNTRSVKPDMIHDIYRKLDTDIYFCDKQYDDSTETFDILHTYTRVSRTVVYVINPTQLTQCLVATLSFLDRFGLSRKRADAVTNPTNRRSFHARFTRRSTMIEVHP